MRDMIRIAGAIIAGGQSSRMQAGGVAGDKFLQKLGSTMIVEHVAERLSPQVDHVFLNANGDPERLPELNIPVIRDKPSSHGGPLVGLKTALEYAHDYPFVVSVAADGPFFPRDLASRLHEQQKNTVARIVLASSNGRVHPIFGLWKTDVLQPLDEWLAHTDKASVLAFAHHIGFEVVEFSLMQLADSETCDPFFNINKPDDLIEATRLNEAMK
ncbi:molybdenum cofactor guanylyltransferase MobA [Ochrobactrum quorumnocens]|uniref:molybdenum cofactor guanylyltransferase MobA n=1 Tax=Ochrobactrum quorumnocens TaxID=271865 RepID=UPI003852F4B7